MYMYSNDYLKHGEACSHMHLQLHCFGPSIIPTKMVLEVYCSDYFRRTRLLICMKMSAEFPVRLKRQRCICIFV